MDNSDIKVHIVHNDDQMKDLNTTRKDVRTYFVLRDIVDRLIGQYLHYSRNLKHVGHVNHLNLDEILKTNPDFDLNNPKNFFDLPSNQNVYCKFLLNWTDFDQDITEEDFKKVKALFDNSNPPIWDHFSKPVKLVNLEALLNIEITPPAFRQSAQEDHDRLLEDHDLVEYIKKLNKWDLKLYEMLNVNE